MINRRLRRNHIAVLCVVLILALAGCIRNPNPALQLDDYDEAQIFYNNAAQAYLVFYDSQTAEMQKTLKDAGVPQAFVDASKALDAWKELKDAGADDSKSITKWITFKNKLLTIGLKYAIKSTQ